MLNIDVIKRIIENMEIELLDYPEITKDDKDLTSAEKKQKKLRNMLNKAITLGNQYITTMTNDDYSKFVKAVKLYNEEVGRKIIKYPEHDFSDPHEVDYLKAEYEEAKREIASSKAGIVSKKRKDGKESRHVIETRAYLDTADSICSKVLAAVEAYKLSPSSKNSKIVAKYIADYQDVVTNYSKKYSTGESLIDKANKKISHIKSDGIGEGVKKVLDKIDTKISDEKTVKTAIGSLKIGAVSVVGLLLSSLFVPGAVGSLLALLCGASAVTSLAWGNNLKYAIICFAGILAANFFIPGALGSVLAFLFGFGTVGIIGYNVVRNITIVANKAKKETKKISNARRANAKKTSSKKIGSDALSRGREASETENTRKDAIENRRKNLLKDCKELIDKIFVDKGITVEIDNDELKNAVEKLAECKEAATQVGNDLLTCKEIVDLTNIVELCNHLKIIPVRFDEAKDIIDANKARSYLSNVLYFKNCNMKLSNAKKKLLIGGFENMLYEIIAYHDPDKKMQKFIDKYNEFIRKNTFDLTLYKDTKTLYEALPEEDRVFVNNKLTVLQNIDILFEFSKLLDKSKEMILAYYQYIKPTDVNVEDSRLQDALDVVLDATRDSFVYSIISQDKLDKFNDIVDECKKSK